MVRLSRSPGKTAKSPGKTTKSPVKPPKSPAKPLKRPASSLALALPAVKKPASNLSMKSKPTKPEPSKHTAVEEGEEEEPREEDAIVAPTQQSVMKKPAQKDPPVMKKPASKKEALLGSFKLAVPTIPPTPEAAENAVAVDGRDRVKSRRFFDMLNKGTLPQAVLDAWSQSSTRQAQNDLINSCFVKDKAGKFALQERFTLPTSYQKKNELAKEERASDNSDGYGRLIFRRMFHLSEEELESCLAKGEVKSCEQNGITLFAATNVRLENQATKATREELNADQQDLDPAAAKAFAKLFEALEPQVEVPVVGAAASSSGQPISLPSGGPAPFLPQSSCFFAVVL